MVLLYIPVIRLCTCIVCEPLQLQRHDVLFLVLPIFAILNFNSKFQSEVNFAYASDREILFNMAVARWYTRISTITTCTHVVWMIQPLASPVHVQNVHCGMTPGLAVILVIRL